MSQMYSWLVRTSAKGLAGRLCVKKSPRVPSHRCARCCLLKSVSELRKSAGLDSSFSSDIPIVEPPRGNWTERYLACRLSLIILLSRSSYSRNHLHCHACCISDRSRLQMIHCPRWEKINYLSSDTFILPDALRPLTRGRDGRLHEDGCVAIEQRNARLCTPDRYSDIFKDPLRLQAFNLKQRTIEEAG